MKSESDPFGFGREQPRVTSHRPLTIRARPGQEIHIVVKGSPGTSTGGAGDSSRATPRPSPDSSRATPRPSPDSSRATPRPSPDASTEAAFGGVTAPRTFSPQPMVIEAQPGQEVLIVAEEDAAFHGTGLGDSSRATPSPRPDNT